MQSTFSGIEIGKRSLIAHNQSMTTAGHNLSNASVEGYSRQRVELKAFDAIYDPALNREETPGQLGQGVSVESVRRMRSELLDQRIVAQTNGESYWKTRDSYLLMLESIYNEPAETSLRTRIDQFWDAWQELSVYPSERSARQAVLTRGQTVTDAIRQRYAALDGARTMIHGDIEGSVRQINDLARQIASLNEQIVKIEAMGDNPNDLLDRRDLLTEKLSGLINVTVSRQDPDEYVIHTSGLELVQGASYRTFAVADGSENEGLGAVVWEESGREAYFTGGTLAALLELRDGDVYSEIQSLDLLTMNFTDMVNDIHRAGVGENGKTGVDFFVQQPFVPNVDGNFDRDGDGVYDSTWLFRASGSEKLDADAQIGLEGVMTLAAPAGTIDVPYYATDRVSDVLQRINVSGADVSASLDREGRLVLKATTSADSNNPDFVLRYIADSGRFLNGYAGILSGSGAENAYTWDAADSAASLADGTKYAISPAAHPSAWVKINDAVLNDALTIASGFPDSRGRLIEGDGSAALAIAAIRNTPSMIGRFRTFDDYFSDAVANIGLKGEQAERALATHSAIMTELRTMRESISGVNIDEELSDIIKFQHGYNAAARFISTYNDMLDTIINRLGV